MFQNGENQLEKENQLTKESEINPAILRYKCFYKMLKGRKMTMSKFELGQVVMTRGIADSDLCKEEITKAITRHSNGDWGDMPTEDKELNDKALESGDDRLMSSYTINGEKIWIITEWDKSITTVLFPSEY